MSGYRESVSSVNSYQQHIPRKNKRKETELFKNQSTQVKRAKKGYYTWCRKIIPKETPPLFKNKVYYRGGTNYKTHGSDYSPNETDGCAGNLSEENENEEDEEFSEDTSEINDIYK